MVPQIVRNAAGQAFETLYRNIGKRAIDEIVPALVQKLDQVCASLEPRVRMCDCRWYEAKLKFVAHRD